jgi:hypothetical protein
MSIQKDGHWLMSPKPESCKHFTIHHHHAPELPHKFCYYFYLL